MIDELKKLLGELKRSRDYHCCKSNVNLSEEDDNYLLHYGKSRAYGDIYKKLKTILEKEENK